MPPDGGRSGAQQVQERLEKQLRRRAKELGFELKKIETAATPTVA